MNTLTKYLINSLKQEQQYHEDSIVNRSFCIELNDFFKNSGKIEISGKFVRACRYALPIPNVRPVKNDMTKYKLINSLRGCLRVFCFLQCGKCFNLFNEVW